MADLAAVAIHYEATPECPSKEAFVRELERKGASADELNAAGELRVVLRESADHAWLGQIAQGELARVVKGSNCEEVAMVLAFAVALVRTRPEPALVPTKGPQPPPPPPTPGTLPAIGFRRSFGFAVGAGAMTSIAPQLVPYVRGEFELVWSRRTLARALYLAPTVTLGGSVAIPDGEANFRFVGAALGACPWAWKADRFSLFPCAAGQFGALLVTGQRKQALPTGARVALGLSAKASVRIAGDFWLDWLGFAGLNVWKDAFYLGDESNMIHNPGIWGFSTGAQLRWHP